MSQIPRPGGSRPLIKTTSTVTSKTPGGGSKISTTTKLRELEPCGTSTGQPCLQSSQRSVRTPQMSGIRTPGRIPPPKGHSTMISQAGTTRSTAHPSTPRAPPPAQMQTPAPGEYILPAQYGPKTRAGKGITFSSPEALRGQMESRVPKDIKYQSVKACPYTEAKSRGALQGTQMADTLAGSFNVYGGPITTEERVDRSVLDQRINQQMAEELFNMSSAEVSMVEEQAAQSLMERSMMEPEERVYSKSQHIQRSCKQPKIQTPTGMEPIIQLTYSEQRVERDDVAERVIKNLSVTDIDEATGRGTRFTISEQQLDPAYGLSSEGKDVVTVKETVSVTPLYTSSAKDVRHEYTTPRLNIDPEELAQMVEEESQDVENTLKMTPPDLSFQDDKYSAKKRLQKFRLNTESMILLEESVVNPTPTADEAITETPPEALANIMHTIEGGVTPECAPDQVFHTLFEEKATEQSVILSSVGPGPLQDVIVPQVLTKDIHKEPMSPDLVELSNLYKNVTDAQDWPPVDIFASVMEDEAKSPKKGTKTRPFKQIQDEEIPWLEEDLEPLVNIVGAEPSVVLDPANVPDLETSGKLEAELSHGIEYFVDADPVQYLSRIQLRGTQPPIYFPGYLYALPEFLDVVKVARSPDEVLVSAWRSCQPKIIPDNSVSILH